MKRPGKERGRQRRVVAEFSHYHSAELMDCKTESMICFSRKQRRDSMMSRILAVFITLLLVPCATLALFPADSPVRWVGHSWASGTPDTVVAPPRTVQSDGWTIRWDVTRGSATREWSHHVPTQFGRYEGRSGEFIFYEQPAPSEGCDYDYEFGRVLSVVGALVSIEIRSGFDCGRPRSSSRFKAIDLRTGEKVDIRLLVPDSALVAALKQNKMVKEVLSRKPREGMFQIGRWTKDPSDLYSLIESAETVSGCEMSFSDLATSFAFHHRSGDRVAVRFGLTHGCEAMGGNLTQFEVSLPIPAILDSDLAKSEAQGHLMKDLADTPFQLPPR